MRCGAVRCNGSVCILTGCARGSVLRPCSDSTNIPHLLLLFSFSASHSSTHPHLLVFPSHSYLLHPRLSPSVPLTRIRSNARFREFVTDNGKRKSFLSFVSIGCNVTKLKCATSRIEERRLKTNLHG